ncbi:hypothetical protein BX661DRAFT_197302 [Kickxella alabastrina]|uniref:uncharacterized protein n=1 Tax=Kickxella alabastrina TaxID=61397 RepID=UPI00221E4F5F|nr:uncharacterized protein BX661DRAFT_197302 [Kickxella alabastrina]KAI7832116.1 hypothetical protein BX661DRAFT_197302 [Kickxella alabastrina]
MSSIQLTKELLDTFIGTTKQRTATLHATHTLAASVFGTLALFWHIPTSINHPLHRVLGRTAFILISGNSTSTQTTTLALRHTPNITCGVHPLGEWGGLVSAGSGVLALGEYAWPMCRLETVERDAARGLAAQYAQLVPLLGGDAMPLVVFTREAGRPFYLVVSGAAAGGADSGFASVAAVRLAEAGAGAAEDWAPGAAVQHWAEYDVLGSALCSEEGEEEDPGPYVVLHGVWAQDTEAGPAMGRVGVPPDPPASTQWALELVAGTHQPGGGGGGGGSPALHQLYREIGRLDDCHAAWAHAKPWQASLSGSALAGHREQFGRLLDALLGAGAGASASSGGASPGAAQDEDGFPRRPDVDFGDRLWLLAAEHARDADDLGEILAAVAEALESGVLQPVLRCQNQCPVACELRRALAAPETAADAAAQLDAWAAPPHVFRVFAELGWEKLRADIGHWLASAQLGLAGAQLGPAGSDLGSTSHLRSLARAAELWWLAREAVPGLPPAFVRQAVVGTLAWLAANTDGGGGGELRAMVALPMYSREVLDFTHALATAAGPAQYAVQGVGPGGHGRRSTLLTRTPAQVDAHFALPVDAEDERYSCFEAILY